MSIIPLQSVDYPESDGKPMGETDLHREEMVRLINSLKRFYAREMVYVSGDLLLFYEEGNPKRFVVPDVFVVKGIQRGPRRSYKLWVEQRTPDVVIEVTSRKTKKVDSTTKPRLYRRLRVREYFLFDPTSDYLNPPLQGYRLVNDRYALISPDAQGALVSEQLGLRLQAESAQMPEAVPLLEEMQSQGQTQLVFYRQDTGHRLLTAEEAAEAAAEAAEAADEARRAAEAEVTRLREALRRRDNR
ncbi:MAG: Uma2 family endonuclease [Pirellulales bacterium]|nr:Uma2 family endonuclease [Pirellulales bacterium]